MRGERVAVLSRRKAAEDAMGEPVFEWDSEIVENVLVRPLGGSDLADARRISARVPEDVRRRIARLPRRAARPRHGRRPRGRASRVGLARPHAPVPDALEHDG